MESKILESRYKEFESDVARLLKKGKTFTVELKGEVIEKVGDGYVKYKIVEITGEAFVIDGWEIVAILNNVGAGNLCYSIVPGDYTKYNGTHCDHCAKIRKRVETFLLRKGEEIKQVGKTCLKDFTRSDDVTVALNLLKFLNKVGEYSIPGEPNYYSVEYLMGISLDIIRKEGYVKSKEYNSTKDKVMKAVLDKRQVVGGEVNEAIEYGKTLDGEFGHNIKVLMETGYVEWFTIGFVAAAANCYLNSKVRGGGHYGTVGERINGRELEVVKKVRFDGSSFGVCYYLTIRDGDMELVWKTGPVKMEVGDRFIGGYRIKAHSKFRGNLVTEVSHVKNQRSIEAAKD